MISKMLSVVLVLFLATGFSPAVTAHDESLVPSGEPLVKPDDSKTDEKKSDVCKTPILISSVDSDELFKAFLHIKKCARPDGDKLDVYVSGMGGDPGDAQAFFDRMRATGLNHRVRFIAYGFIASASNIVWMAADERVVTPQSVFILHKARVVFDDDPELGVSVKNNLLQETVKSFRLAAGEKAAHLWEQSCTGKIAASALSSDEAIQNGWATRLENYK